MEVVSLVSQLWYYIFPLSSTAHTVSVWLTVAIAAQRCQAVRDPLKVSHDEPLFDMLDPFKVCSMSQMGVIGLTLCVFVCVCPTLPNGCTYRLESPWVIKNSCTGWGVKEATSSA